MDLSTLAHQMESRKFPLSWPGQWINGAWHQVKKAPMPLTSTNPNNGQSLTEVYSDKSSVDAAIAAGFEIRKEIGAQSIARRAEHVKRFRQALIDHQRTVELTLRLEAGKPAWEAREDLEAASRYLDWVARNPEEVMRSLLAPARLGPGNGAFELLPIGVVAAYLPFSTPLTSFAFYFGAAMIAGCPLIINSSSHAIVSCMVYALLSREAGLPPSAMNIVFGNFNTFKQLMADRRLAAVIYTGSREHCDAIRIESRNHVGRQMVLQSGGKNAAIVHSSADLDYAVKCVTYGALKSAGQRCSSTSRVFVYRSALPEFRDRLMEAFQAVRVGRTDTDDAPAPFMGPLYSAKAVEKFLRFQTMANREAEKTLLWGKALEAQGGGFFVTPSLHYMTRFDNTGAYQGNVLFSPSLAIYDYDVLDQAIDQINTTDAAFSVSFIGDPAVVAERRHLFLAPNLMVNAPTVESEATLPLAGRLQSGHHRFHGPGIALYLCYPQVLAQDPELEARIRSWPWPAL